MAWTRSVARLLPVLDALITMCFHEITQEGSGESPNEPGSGHDRCSVGLCRVRYGNQAHVFNLLCLVYLSECDSLMQVASR